jgi:flagellar basal-body rod protein FlgG
MRALWISGSGMAAEEQKLDLIANNMANLNTVGFKFQDAYVQEMSQVDDDGRNVQVNPAGTTVSSITRNFTQGNIQSTGNSLDVAINGDGFFEVTMPDETTGYTRSGQFSLDANGTLVTANGNKVYPEVTVSSDTSSVAINANGQITATKNDGTTQVIGSLELAKFINPGGLTDDGQGVFKPSANSGDPVVDSPGKQGLGTLQQGYTEGSNVDLASEMLKMMLTQRSYEMNTKVLQTTDQMMSLANGIKR